MTVELVAIGCLFAFSVFSFIFGLREYKKEKEELLQKFNIEDLKEEFVIILDERFNIETLKLHFSEMFPLEQLKDEFTEIVDERLQAAIDAIGEAFQGIITEPTVKKAFGIIGSQGGEAKAMNTAVDDMAKDIIDGPQFAAIKLGAEALGIDVDAYIEKHGAMKTMRAAQQLGQFAGIDIMNLDLGSLSLPGPSSSGFRRVFQ